MPAREREKKVEVDGQRDCSVVVFSKELTACERTFLYPKGRPLSEILPNRLLALHGKAPATLGSLMGKISGYVPWKAIEEVDAIERGARIKGKGVRSSFVFARYA